MWSVSIHKNALVRALRWNVWSVCKTGCLFWSLPLHVETCIHRHARKEMSQKRHLFSKETSLSEKRHLLPSLSWCETCRDTSSQKRRVCLKGERYLKRALLKRLYSAKRALDISRETCLSRRREISHKRHPCWDTRIKRYVVYCNTLQHTATYCNTLQHTATHYIKRDMSKETRNSRIFFQKIMVNLKRAAYTATHCNTLQHTATHCNSLIFFQKSTVVNLKRTVYCNTRQHTTTCNTLQHTASKEPWGQSQKTRVLYISRIYGPSLTPLQHTATHCNTLQHTATPRNTLQPPETPCIRRLEFSV